jgi:drug/metabolite transporter (DMT)-like permease
VSTGLDSSAREQRVSIAVFILIALIGGGNAIGVAAVVDELDPLWAAALRFLLSGAVFVALMGILRIPIPRGGALAGAALYGGLGFFGAFAFLFWGLREAPPGASQTIIALVPLLTLLLAVAHRLERFSARALVGSLVAFGGLAYLVSDRIDANVPLASLLAIVAGAVFLAESGIVLKLTPRMDPIASNAVGMLSGGVLLLVASGVAGDRWAAPAQSDTWIALVFLVFGGSVAVFWLFAFLLRRWDASSVAYTLLLQPIATISYSAVLTGEPITPSLLLGGAIIVGGVYIGAFSRRGGAPEPPGASEAA